MRRACVDAITQEGSFIAETRNNRLRCFVSCFCCLSLYFVTTLGSFFGSPNAVEYVARVLTSGPHYSLHLHRIGGPQMLSSQSKTIATATVILFRRFTAVSGFRPLSTQSTPVSTLATRNFLQPLVSQGSTEKPKSQCSTSQVGQERKSSLRRHLSSVGQNEEKVPQKASFSVPSMGTDPNDETMMTTKHHSEYEKWVRRLYATNMFHPVKLGLENMHLLHELLGSPMDDVSVQLIMR